MRRTCASLVALVGSLLAISGNGNAETRTISWTPVTTYADGTAIEPSMTVTYDIYWTMDPGLSVSSLKSVATSVARTSAVFDPDALGMPRGQTVYFTGDAVLLTGAASSLARATPWTVMAGSIVLPAPQNVALTGPMAAAPSKTFRLKWDPVTARADGGAIPAGEVRYTPYWSSDPNFPAAALRLLATPTGGDFRGF